MKILTFLKICRIALVISTLLQIVAFCVPGWVILSVTSSDLEARHGLDLVNSADSEVSVHFSVWYVSICAYIEEFDHDYDYNTPDKELDECKVFTYTAMKATLGNKKISNFFSSTITISSDGFFSVTQWQVELTVALFISLVLIGLVQFQLKAKVAYDEDQYADPPHKAVYIAAVILAIMELILLGIPTFTLFWTTIHILRSEFVEQGLTVGIPYALIISFCAMLALVVAGECLEKLACRTEEPPAAQSITQTSPGTKPNVARGPESVPMYTYAPSCLQYLNEQPNQPLVQDRVSSGHDPYREYKLYPPKLADA